MGVFLRGKVWWMEYRTGSVRVVRSTGQRDKAKAQSVYAALRVAMGAKPPRSAMESVLDAIYSSGATKRPLSSVWKIYQEWCVCKGRKASKSIDVGRRNLLSRFIEWAAPQKVVDVDDVTVAVTRNYIASLRASGLSNKTLRNYAQYLSAIWRGMAQMVGDLPNPWLAACPDKDGSSLRREAFSREQEAAVLDAARKIGHDWYLASMVARWTGLRYGDVARLDWAQIDLASRCISVTPSKTAKHGVRVVLPVSDALLDALRSVPEDRREGFLLPEHAMHYPMPMDVPFSDALRSAGLDTKRFTFHSWRHTFRTRLSDAGVADDLARRLGGWTNLGMAAHYDHAERLGDLLGAVNSAR